MPKALLIENVSRDAERLTRILAKKSLEAVVCQSGAEAKDLLKNSNEPFAIAFDSLEIAGPPSAEGLAASPLGVAARTAALPRMRAPATSPI